MEGLSVDVGCTFTVSARCLRWATGHYLATGVRCCVNVSLCHENRGNSTYSFVPPHLTADIAFRALFTDTKARFVLSGCPMFIIIILFFFLRVVPRACCSRTTPLGYYCRERRRGMCLGSVGRGLDPRQPHRWLESQSLSFSVYLVRFCPILPPHHSPCPPHPTPPPPTLCR